MSLKKVGDSQGAGMNYKNSITVYGRRTSSNVQAVLWGLAELGLGFDQLDYGHVYGGLDSVEFRALNPQGLVPVIRDGELAVWESCAILRYLGGRYGDGKAFWPNDPVARAAVDVWAEWGKTSFSGDFTVTIFWLRVRTAAKDRNEAKLARNIAAFEKRLDILESQLADHKYVVSDDFTLADIVIGHALFRWFDMDIPRQSRPIIQAYYQRLTNRPAYKKHVMVGYEPLRVAGA